MPDLVTHYYFGCRVADTLPDELTQHLDRPLYDHATAGPDVWMSVGFPFFRQPALSSRGSIMHKTRCGEFLQTLAEEAKSRPQSREALFSYLAGFLCHYFLDSFCHPYIISMTGQYRREEPDTLRYRGNHVRFERAIDCYVIREFFHTAPGRFPFLRLPLLLRRLPTSLREGLNSAFVRVYGWENAYDELRIALRDERFFFFCCPDRFGILYRLLKRFDKGLTVTDHKQYSYWHKDIDPAVYDVLNESHRPWRHYADPSLVSGESFFELFEKARERCTEAILACRDFVFGDAPYPAGLIGRRSYESGLNWDDPRHRNRPQYDERFTNAQK